MKLIYDPALSYYGNISLNKIFKPGLIYLLDCNFGLNYMTQEQFKTWNSKENKKESSLHDEKLRTSYFLFLRKEEYTRNPKLVPSYFSSYESKNHAVFLLNNEIVYVAQKQFNITKVFLVNS